MAADMESMPANRKMVTQSMHWNASFMVMQRVATTRHAPSTAAVVRGQHFRHHHDDHESKYPHRVRQFFPGTALLQFGTEGMVFAALVLRKQAITEAQ